jgi:hypothetical protein
MARAKKKFRPKRRQGKYSRRKKSTRGFKRVECQLGRAALQYSRAKGFLSRVEKSAARGKAENPGMTLKQWSKKSGIRPAKDHGGTYVISERRNNKYHTDLWHLSDYKVSSVGAHIVWLVPVNNNPYFKTMMKSDVGKYVEGFGYILKRDVGKRVRGGR